MTRYRLLSKNDAKVHEAICKEWPGELGQAIMSALVGWSEEGGKVMDGDAFVLRDALLEHGCVWGTDFYIRKVEEDTECSKKKENKHETTEVGQT